MSSTKSKVSTIESDVKEVKSEMSSMSSKINEVEKKVSSTNSTIESDVAVVKKSVGWKFVGMGGYVTYDESYSPGDGHTLAECFGLCTNKRSSDSNWNGVMFRHSDGWCGCYKNDAGHNPLSYKDWMHFKC